MCTGLEWLIPVIASGVGVAGQAITMNEQQKQAQQQAKARNDALRDTLLKNTALADQSRDTFAQRLAAGSKDSTEEMQAKAGKERNADLTQAVAPTADMSSKQSASITGSAPKVVNSDLASRMQSAIQEGKTQAKALGKLGSYGDSWLQQGFLDTQAGRDIGTIANKAAGNSAILPYSQDFAEQAATHPISPLGSILGGLGSAFGSWAGSQSSPTVARKSYTTPFVG